MVSKYLNTFCTALRILLYYYWETDAFRMTDAADFMDHIRGLDIECNIYWNIRSNKIIIILWAHTSSYQAQICLYTLSMFLPSRRVDYCRFYDCWSNKVYVLVLPGIWPTIPSPVLSVQLRSDIDYCSKKLRYLHKKCGSKTHSQTYSIRSACGLASGTFI